MNMSRERERASTQQEHAGGSSENELFDPWLAEKVVQLLIQIFLQ